VKELYGPWVESRPSFLHQSIVVYAHFYIKYFFYHLPDSRRARTFLSKKMTGMEDVFAAIPLGVSSLGTGPGVITAGEKSLG